MSAHGFHIQVIDRDTFRVSWTIDRKVSGSRLRFPTTYSKLTDVSGAKRFAKKHGLTAPA